MIDGAPPLYWDWPSLLETAEKILAGRLAGDPAEVERKRLTRKQADDRARIMGAIVAQWRAVTTREPIPQLGATGKEMLEALAAIAVAARSQSNTRANDADLLMTAAYATALSWWQVDVFGQPRIAFIHETNLELRARSARKAA